jgi:starch-binding outer membrane protein, SusD/RagB family
MKNILIFSITFLLIFTYSCDEKLDIPPYNILTAEQVFESESAITAYLASLYDVLPTEDHRFTGSSAVLMKGTDESLFCWAGPIGTPDGTWSYLDWWGYNHVRNVNDLINKLPEASLSEDSKKIILGESKFMRAFYYFALVKRYGGVPIIEEVQQFTGDNLEELQVPRNSEKEVWDFIASELDEAIALLPETNQPGRANKYVALALKSRAMLYAASIAKYGSVMLNGLLGIPASDADNYWQKAYDAAEKIISSNNYSLYNKNPDKEKNFSELFIDTDNPEAIFTVSFQYPSKTHSYEVWFLPFAYRSPQGFSSMMAPTLQMVEQYEYIDGSEGTLKLTNSDGSPIYYENATDLFSGKDPRCMGTVIVPFGEWRGNIVDVQAGIYDQGIKYEASSYEALYNPNTHQPDNENGTVHIVGRNGFGAGMAEMTFSGFYVRKYLNYNMEQSKAVQNACDQQFIVFRYAEVLLNFAEAAAELNYISDAKFGVNLVRDRAGIKLLDDNEVTVERIKHERLVELAFENHRWWDYIRWRESDDVINNFWDESLRPYWDITEGAYRFEKGIATSQEVPKDFSSRAYYQRIPPGEIGKNPKLEQNPGY